MGRNPKVRYFKRDARSRWHYYRTVHGDDRLHGCFSATDTWSFTGWTLDTSVGELVEIPESECPYLDRPIAGEDDGT